MSYQSELKVNEFINISVSFKIFYILTFTCHMFEMSIMFFFDVIYALTIAAIA